MEKAKRFINRIKTVFYNLAVLGVLLVPFAGMLFFPTTKPIGNTPLADPPSLFTEDGFWNLRFLSDAGDWFSSRFAFRPQAVTADALMKATVFGESTQENVVVGKDGWLYYASTMDDWQRKTAASDRMLFNVARNLALLQEKIEERGGTFVFTVAPNKVTLYPEHLPAMFAAPSDKPSDAERLLPYLEKEGVVYADLFRVFENEKDVLYYARDSHWTEEGALLAYAALMKTAGLTPTDFVSAAPEETPYYGDLSLMLYPAGLYPERRRNYLSKDQYEITNDAESVESAFITAENTEADASMESVFLYRDSFGNSLLPYFAESFGRSAFSKEVPYQTDLSENYRVVIAEIAERHLQTLSRAPALTEGPVRTIDLCEDADAPLRDKNNDSTILVKETEEYYRISGHVSPAYLEDDGRIFVRIADDRGFTVYEAFCTSVGEDDYGYLLQVKKTSVQGKLLGAQTMTAAGDKTEHGRNADGKTLPITVQIVSEHWEDPSMAGTLVLPEEEEETEEPEEEEPQVEEQQENDKEQETEEPDAAEGKPASEINETTEPKPSVVTAPVAPRESTPATPVVEEPTAETPAPQPEPAAQLAPATVSEPAVAPAPEPTGRYETGRQFIQDCYEGATGGYWDITYSDGTHEYIDVP